MILLIPHTGDLNKGNGYDFGTVRNELEVESALFRKAATMFCLAHGDIHLPPTRDILGKLKQYNIWNKIVHTSSSRRNRRNAKMNRRTYNLDDREGDETPPLYRSSTLNILEDICNRSIEKEADRIPIMGNCCNYSTRLDTSESSEIIASGKYGLSTCMLALCVLSGEIMRNDLPARSEDALKYTLRDYLAKFQFDFNPPGPAYQLSFIEHCRFSKVKMTPYGIQTQGWLYRLSPPTLEFAFTEVERVEVRRKREQEVMTTVSNGRSLDPLDDDIMWRLIRKLNAFCGRESHFATFLRQHMDVDKRRIVPLEPSKYFTDRMIKAIVQAVIDGCPLCLARLEGESPFAQPSAVFVAPLSERKRSFGEESWVFTSWDNGIRNRHMEKFVSIEVRPGHSLGTNRCALLHTRNWTNGVWDVRGRYVKDYMFPLPGASAPEYR